MPKLIRIDNANLLEKTYNILKELIIKREFPPEHKLSIPELSAQLGVSRTPIRDALGRLEMDGLIKTVPKVGTFVVGFSSENVLDIMDTRLMIELWVVEKLASGMAKASQDIVANMEKIHETSVYIVNSSKLENYHEGDYNLHFHMEFLKLGGNRNIQNIYQNTMNYRYLAMKSYLITKEMVLHSLQQHERIIGSLKAGSHDDLRQVVSEHLEDAKIRLYKNINLNGGLI
ncbi:GntR family transcriptional regulator [Paenibacillus rhizophilus]|uniref:GntR family transcriptional regulator n=1 Tax=Paenibacillus rhizophilus TaxID=1850366 RepID=A0A3N9P9Z6_9BACL|nr:GntR family transcriptional regulator [Paenibacillus rhizophilus]RQW12310.1 GntR family transcriptional regulator [Paenibacillus rhizophilus]